MSKLRWVAAFLLLVLVIPVQSGAAGAEPNICKNRANNTPRKIMDCVTLEGVRAHQAALQAIADANGGTRFAGTPGRDASVHMWRTSTSASSTSPTPATSRPR